MSGGFERFQVHSLCCVLSLDCWWRKTMPQWREGVCNEVWLGDGRIGDLVLDTCRLSTINNDHKLNRHAQVQLFGIKSCMHDYLGVVT